MFRGFGNLFHGSNSPKPNSPREDSDYSLISMFSQNLVAFSNIKKRDPVKKDLFLDLISHFQIIFSKANPKQLCDEETKNIFISYLKICSENGMFIFDSDETVIDNYFDSIIFTASLFDNIIPNADIFFEFFCNLVNKIQENQIFLKNSQIFLAILFKSPQFFAQFLLNDGLCIVFSSIFLKNDQTFYQTQEIFLEFIFKSSPQEIFSQIPFSNVTNFNVFLDMLKPLTDYYDQQNSDEYDRSNTEESKNGLYLKNACMYVSLYLKSFNEICPSLINDFNAMSGFSILNNIFIYDSDDKSSAECYKLLLESTEMNEVILGNFADLYQNEKTKSTNRTSMICYLFMNNQSSIDLNTNIDDDQKDKINKFLKKLTKIAPISSFFKRPPFLDRKGLEYCASLIKFFLKQNMDQVSMILNIIMKIIAFPEDDQIPTNLYFQLLIDEFQTGELNIDILLDNQCNFVHNFILKPSVKEMTSYYHHNKIAFTLLYYVYISNKAKLYRYEIIQKFVLVLNVIFDQQQKLSIKEEQRKIELELECNQYIDFLFSLLESSFSVPNCKLLLSFLEKPPIMKVLTLILKVRNDYFDLFIKSNGFSYLNDYIQNNPTKTNYLSVLKLLSSLSYFYHHFQIDEWILNQPINSPLFKFPKDLMEKAAIGIDINIDNDKKNVDFKSDINVLHIPSFLPFCDDFDCSLEYNLYLAGRFGVPSFIKMGISVDKIPHISMIANRFITPEIIRITFSDNMKIIPEFANIYRPHFPLFELIPKSYNIPSSSNSMPDNIPIFLSFEKQFSSFSFWFRIPIQNHSKISLMSVSPKLLQIFIDNDEFVIKTNKEKTKVPFVIDDNWHNIIVSFLGKRNIINCVNIRIDNLNHIDLIELKIEEQFNLPSSLVLGDTQYLNSVPLQFAKNILLFENALNNEKANKIFQKGLYHPTQKIKCTKSSQFVFNVHYLGFPTYYKNKAKIENIFDFLDHLDSIDEYKCIFNVLLNLQLLNNINFNYFWHRLIISLKRKKDLINNELPYFVHISTKQLLNVELRMKEIKIFLSDTEFYFIFNHQSIKNLLDSILSDNSIDWNCLENFDLTNSLLSIIKSGIKEDIQLLLVPVLNKLLKANQTAAKLRSFMNSVISMSDLSYTFDMFNTMIQFDELIRIPKTEDASNSEVINQLLISFVESAKICFEEVYSLKQLLILMYLYSDEKTTILADLLAFYSYKNPSYLKNYPQNLVNYIFSQLSDYSKMWKAAISILTSELKIKNQTEKKKNTTIFIKKPDFLPVILGMLESLASKCSYYIIQQNKKKSNTLKLFTKVVNKLLNIEPTQFYLLYQEKNCDKYLNSLLFLGIIPNSYISDSNDTTNNRLMKISPNFQIDPPSKSEVKDIISLTTSSPLFAPINVPEKFYNEQQLIQSNSSLYFPNDLEDCQPLIDFIDESNLLELFISILFAENDNSNPNLSIDSLSSFNDSSSDNGNNDENDGENASNDSRFKSKLPDLLNIPSRYFERYLLDFLNGTALMYINYWREVANRLIFKILNRIYSSNIPNSINYLKSTFEGIHKCIISGVFSENYLDLLELVFLIFKKGEFTIDQFLSDDKYLEFYREFLLMTFHFSPLQKKNYKYDMNEKDPIFDILMKNKDFVFTKIIFSDNKFASLWIHASRIYNQKLSAILRDESNQNNNNDTKNEKNSNEDGETDPSICCMSFLLAVIDNSVVSSYDPVAMGETWRSFLSRDIFDSQDVESKISKMNSIIQMKQNMRTKAAKCELISKIFRAVNLSVEQNLAFYKINIRQRQNERMMFLHNQISRKRNLANANISTVLLKTDENCYIHSFHLSPLSYPICQPRAITPSPFIIKPPPNSSSNSSKETQQENASMIHHSSKIGYAVDYFRCKERIQAIEKCGLLNCSPEWCYFNSTENHSEFSSVFEYSQIIEQGPPSTLSLFEDAFSEYFNPSSNQSSLIALSSLASLNSLTSLSTMTSLTSIPSLQAISSTQIKKYNYLCFDVSFLYYIHTIPSVLFLTENYLLIVILAKGSLQLISQPENPVAFLPFSENVALGEYNNKVSIFCGHVVITIKYDHILKMNSHLYIHKNVGLAISSLRSADIILIFNSTNEMRQANNFIITNRSQKQQLNLKQKKKQTDIQQLNKQFNTNQQKDHIVKAKSMVNPPSLNTSASTISGFGLSLNLNLNSNFLSLDQFQIFPPCPNLILFTVDSLSSASLLWKNNIISNFDYLLLLNSFGGRSFLDLTQYPVVPWIAKPDIKAADGFNEDSDNKSGSKNSENTSKNTSNISDTKNTNNNDESTNNNNTNTENINNVNVDTENANNNDNEITTTNNNADSENNNNEKEITTTTNNNVDSDNNTNENEKEVEEKIDTIKNLKENENELEDKILTDNKNEFENNNENALLKSHSENTLNENDNQQPIPNLSNNDSSAQLNQAENSNSSSNDENEYDATNCQDINEKEIEFQMRNLSLPMGQLSKSRSRHFDQTYELSAPKKYFYGFHYSLPGAVFWLLMRTPPFTFFQWDLNDGWDNSQRLFVSLSDAYNSAASTNPSDLKELVPALYQVPESLMNVSQIKLNVSNDNVILPSWSNFNPFFFTETHLRLLNSTNQIQKWIDLIFGYKQNGEVAIEFKNLFLPSSYHNSCAEDLEMDQESYNSQVLNFGQCPIQLFNRAHPFKLTRSVSHSPSFDFLNRNSISKTTKEKSKQKRKTENLTPIRCVNSAPTKEIIPKPRVRSSSSSRKDIPRPSTPVPTYTKKMSPFAPNSLNVKNSFNERDIFTRSQNNSPIPSLFNSSNQVFRGNCNLWSWEMKDILHSGELINPLNLRSFIVAPIEKVFIALPKDAVFYPLKCSGSTFFFIIDKVLESLSFIRMSESMEIVFAKFSSKFAFANHLAVSDDGMFIAVSFSFGSVVVYRIVFDEAENEENENKNDRFISNFIKIINTNSSAKSSFIRTGCPKGIEKFGSYSNKIISGKDKEENECSSSRFSCHMSTLLPQDFLCASAFGDGSVIIWNFATETRHRVLWPYNDLILSTESSILRQINFDESDQESQNNNANNTKHATLPVSLVFDPFDAVLSIAYSNGIIQYSLNGYKLRDFAINSTQKCRNTSPIAKSKFSKLFSTDEEDTIEIDPLLGNEFETNIQTQNPVYKAQNNLHLEFNSKKASISCIAILGMDFMFNKRLLIAGLSDGSLLLLSASSSNYSFVESGTIKAHSSPVSSILCQPQMMRAVTVDLCGIVRLIDFGASLDQTSVIVRCSFCDNPQSTVCKMCQMPICNGCLINGTGLCRSCYLK